MESFTRPVLILSGLVITILAMPKPDGFDDEGEMSVPRSPKIQGPAAVNLPYVNHTAVENLECQIEGSPTPIVIWLKDGQELQSSSDLYNMTYDATAGKAKLCFMESARRDEKYTTGNFTCIAANFLGRVQKIFMMEITKENVSTSTMSSTSISTPTSENIIASTSGDYDTTTVSITDASANLSTTVNQDFATSSLSSTVTIGPEVTELVTSTNQTQLTSSKPDIIANNGTLSNKSDS